MQGIKDLTTGSIRRQLFNLAMPIMGTSFIQMAYSLTDMAWVGRLGSEAVATIGAVAILTWLISSFSLLNKVGAEVSVGQSIGAKDEENARTFASHNTTIALTLAISCGILFFLFARPVLSIYKLDREIEEHAITYLRIISTAFPFVFLTSAFTGIYNASGQSRIPFYISGTGLLLNMLLDPLFILVFKWGTTGAACATWIAEAFVVCLFIYQIRFKDRLMNGFPFLVSLKRLYTKKIFILGTPVALLNMFFAIINLLMGRTASTQGGHIGLTTLTAGGQIEAIAWNTSQGFSTALSTFTAQNYAAGKKDRLQGAYHATLVMTTVIGIFCTLLFVFFGSEVFSVIIPEREAYIAGGVFLRIDGYSMLFMMMEITIQGLFYGTGRTIPPAIISITFNTLRIPLAILLSSYLGMGIEGVWWAISITSILKGIVAFLWFRTLRKKIF
ncbi:MAG: MATE family efflux transporter [Tannerellaceae bacterium]|nr:MATE family efflux transporter [Tannerellaceae bacterium]